jgi:hypothetical protein
LVAAALGSTLLLFLSAQVGVGKTRGSSGAQESCLAAARAALGPGAVVLKCGHLIGPGDLEVAAAIPLRPFRADASGTAVSRLVILRKAAGTSRWVNEFTADKDWTRNPAGYVGVEYIDDSFKYTGYRVSFSGRRSDGAPGFTLFLFSLNPNGSNEGVPLEVGWNRSVKRFQEFSYEAEPVGFRAEIKNPPHIRTPGPK